MPGPLPTGKAIRRNAPTIPTTELRAGGPDRPVPAVPQGYKLRAAGKRFWEWAWHTPQACAWDDGVLFTVARRAGLEDLLCVSSSNEFSGPVFRLATELDDRLGLTPKAMAQLRWKIVDDVTPVEVVAPEVASLREARNKKFNRAG